jgi:hypothetical protein
MMMIRAFARGRDARVATGGAAGQKLPPVRDRDPDVGQDISVATNEGVDMGTLLQ